MAMAHPAGLKKSVVWLRPWRDYVKCSFRWFPCWTANAQNPQPTIIDDSSISPTERASQIAVIQSQLVELRKVYKENYPEIARLKRQLQDLQDSDRASQISAIQSQLLELRKVYRENYPEIQRLENQLRALQDQHGDPK